MGDTEIFGRCDEKLLAIKDAFEKNFDDGLELGGAFALSVQDEMVVDLWGGFADRERSHLWQEDTIVPVASCSKVICSLCGLMLIDRGLIELDEPVATYWPEFAAAGKERLPVRYVFCHATGLAGLDGMPGEDIWNDWEEVVTRLAAQKPWWEPGTKSGYHGMTYGHLIGELVRRTTGMTISEFFRDEVAAELDIDFTFGLPEESFSRRAEIASDDVWTETDEAIKKSIYYRAFGYLRNDNGADTESDISNSTNPASNGFGNARSLAKAGGLLAAGGIVRGQRFISEETAALPYQEQIYTHDLIFWAPVRYGVGFGMASKEFPLPWPKAFHWGGAGGSTVIMVPEHGAAFCYTPNQFIKTVGVIDDRGRLLKDAVAHCLEHL